MSEMTTTTTTTTASSTPLRSNCNNNNNNNNNMIGARCRVYYDKGNDFFRRDQKTISAGGWFLGIVEAPATPQPRGVHKGQARVKVRFDDHSCDFVLQHDVDILTPGTTASNRHLWFSSLSSSPSSRSSSTTTTGSSNSASNSCSATTTSSSNEQQQQQLPPQVVVAANTCPHTLQCGDLVLGQFQGGSMEGAWYRGRICATGTYNGHAVCDIAYDDGDYECVVPFGKEYPAGNYVTLLEKSADHPAWLVGLTVQLPSRKKIPHGVIQQAEKGKPVLIQYTDDKDGGLQTMEKKSYRCVVAAFFRGVEGLATRVHQWPYKALLEPKSHSIIVGGGGAVGGGGKENTIITTKTNSRRDVKGAKKRPLGEQSKSKRSNHASNNRAAKKSKKDTSASRPNPPKATQDSNKTQPKQKAPLARRGPLARGRKRDDEEVFAVDVQSAVADPNQQDPFNVMQDASDSVEHMPDSLSDSLVQALKSPDAFLGENMLTFMANFHNQIPTPHDLKALVDILLYGPQTSRGNFPDCRRLQLTQQYFTRLVTQYGLANVIAESLDKDYWQRVLEQMKAPYYTLEGDEMSPTAMSVQRIALSLHARACCMESFQVLLYQQLCGCLAGPLSDEEKAYEYRNRPLVHAILSHSRGVKEALETATKTFVQTCIQYGHLAVGDLSNIPDLSIDIANFAARQTDRLLKAMGKTVSYLAVLYSKETHEDMVSVAYLVGHIAQREFDEADLDHCLSNFWAMNDELSDDDLLTLLSRIKLRFVLNLDQQLVPELYPKLADALHVAQQFNAIFDY